MQGLQLSGASGGRSQYFVLLGEEPQDFVPIWLCWVGHCDTKSKIFGPNELKKGPGPMVLRLLSALGSGSQAQGPWAHTRRVWARAQGIQK